MNRAKIEKGITNNLSDWVDGFCLVGFIAGTNERIVVAKADDPKTMMALNAFLCQVVTSGGVREAPHEGNR